MFFHCENPTGLNSSPVVDLGEAMHITVETGMSDSSSDFSPDDLRAEGQRSTNSQHQRKKSNPLDDFEIIDCHFKDVKVSYGISGW